MNKKMKRDIGTVLVSLAGLYIILDFTVFKNPNYTLSAIVALLAIVGFVLVQKNKKTTEQNVKAKPNKITEFSKKNAKKNNGIEKQTSNFNEIEKHNGILASFRKSNGTNKSEYPISTQNLYNGIY